MASAFDDTSSDISSEALRRGEKRRARGTTCSHHSERGSATAPWIVTLSFAAAAGIGGYLLWEKYQGAKAEATVLQAEVVSARQRASAAEDKVMALSADLSAAKGKFESTKEEVEHKAAAIDELQEKLQALVSTDQGEVSKDGDAITLQLVDKVLFRLGEAELTPKGLAVLAQVGAAINEFPDKQVWVQGHTDDVPIKKDNSVFPSNWELSATRALNVVHYLQDTAKVNPARLAAVAFSEYRPVSRTKKARNRRIEIVLYPKRVELD